MFKLSQYALLFVIVILYSLKHRDNLGRLLKLFFCHEKFVSLAVEETIKMNCEASGSYKTKYENDENWKAEEIAKCTKQLFENTKKVKNSIWEAFWTVAKTLGFAWLIACVVTNSILFPSNLSSILQIISAFLILWALIGKLGYPIQTFDGQTLPELIDNFWFIVLNVLGVLCLFFSQFYFSFKAVDEWIIFFNPKANIYEFNKLSIWGEWLLLLFITVSSASLVVGIIISKIRKKLTSDNLHENKLIAYLGFLELFAYSISFIISKPEFIAIWLGVKSLNRWKDETKNKEINIFLLGNLLNVIFSFIIGLIFYNIGIYLNIIENNNYIFSKVIF